MRNDKCFPGGCTWTTRFLHLQSSQMSWVPLVFALCLALPFCIFFAWSHLASFPSPYCAQEYPLWFASSISCGVILAGTATKNRPAGPYLRIVDTMYHWTHSFVQPLSLSFPNPDWLCSLFPEVQRSDILSIMSNPRRTSLLKFWWWHVVTSSLYFMTLTSCFTLFRLMRMVRIRSKCPRPMSFDVPGSCDWFFDRVFGWFTTSMRCRPFESWPKFTCKGSSLPAAHLEMIIQKTLASLPEAALSSRKFAS